MHVSELDGVELDCASRDGSSPADTVWFRSPPGPGGGAGRTRSLLQEEPPLCCGFAGTFLSHKGCSSIQTEDRARKVEASIGSLGEASSATRLNQCLKVPDPLLHFRIWNPLTRTSRTHCLPSTHHLRPRQPRFSGSCSAWRRDSTVGMGCAASLTSSSPPRGPYSTCSRKPV